MAARSKRAGKAPKKPAAPATDKPKRSVGRPTEYDPKHLKMVQMMCELGATDIEIAEALGINVLTLYRWRAKYPEFCKALVVGKQQADARVERSLYNRAVGYSYPALKIMQHQGMPVEVPYTEHVPPDPGAAKLWLTNRKPSEWREKVELSGNPDAPLQYVVVPAKGA